MAQAPETASRAQRDLVAAAEGLQIEWKQFGSVLMLNVSGSGPVPGMYRLYSSRSDYSGRISHRAEITYVVGQQSHKVTLRQLRYSIMEESRRAARIAAGN